MAKGIIYVLTNPAMSGYVKIGKTTNLEARLKSLDNTSVPVPFQCVFAAEVDDFNEIETLLHDAFADARSRSTREFFEIDEQRVISALQIAKGKDVTPGKDVAEDAESLRALEKASERREKRERLKFSMIGLRPGDEISYLRNNEIKATIIDDRNIRFEGEKVSISGAARILLWRDDALSKHSKGVQGAQHWEYDGETLSQRRHRMEEEEEKAAAEQDLLPDDPSILPATPLTPQ